MIRFLIAAGLVVLAAFVLVPFFLSPVDSREALEKLDEIAQKRVVDTFQAPEPGDRIRIELSTGATREGVIRSIDDNEVVLTTRNGEVTYPRQYIAPRSRQLLFRSDFEGTPLAERPAEVVDIELIQLLHDGTLQEEASSLRRPNIQYVIAGTNAIILYGFAESFDR